MNICVPFAVSLYLLLHIVLDEGLDPRFSSKTILSGLVVLIDLLLIYNMSNYVIYFQRQIHP